MDTLFKPYADRLLGCLCAQWEDEDPDKPQRCCFRFDSDLPTMGIALGEDECKCGTAWVRFVDAYVSSDSAFPGPENDIAEQNCPRMWALVLEMGIGRCPPTGDQNKLPTCEQLDDFHNRLLDDFQRLRKAYFCCFMTVDYMDRAVFGQLQRSGPNGKCYQQAVQITVMVINCDECLPEVPE